MAQNITLQGATYYDVPAVDLPKSGGGTARFIDITESGTPVYDGTTTSDTKYDALFMETVASGVSTIPLSTEIDTVWTNSSPSSNFVAQTISSLNLSGYKYLIIQYALSKSYNQYRYAYVLIIDGYDNVTFFPQYKNWNRSVKATTTSITFTDCISYNTYGNTGSSVTNDYMIPMFICGVK